MCESQQDIFVEGSCSAQLCEAGECSYCYSESSCGSYAWCSWGGDNDDAAASCGPPSCEEGKEPNVEEGTCDPCEAGKYSAVSNNDACTRCSAGTFSEVVGSVSVDDCAECEAGKVSGAEGSTCVPITGIAATAGHGWDFRGCIDGEAVVDGGAGSELKATLMNGAQCTAEGVAFDGVDDYVDLDDWEWGGTLTIEAYVKYTSFNFYGRVLDFSNGAGFDNVYLANFQESSMIMWSVRQGNSKREQRESSWDLDTWTHVVVKAEGSLMEVFKNGASMGSFSWGQEPLTMTRTQHWLGRSAWDSDAYFKGSIAYVRTWHGVGLEEEGVQALFLEREVGGDAR
jgi:hypothetical protein